MKVIALIGEENTGKSHTINIIYTFLLRDGYVQIPGHFRELGNPAHKDFIDILEYHDKKVGFVSLGDYVTGVGRSLRSLLEELRVKGCDVAICASRNNPKIISAVTAYPLHILENKTHSSGRENDRTVNVKDALKMITHI